MACGTLLALVPTRRRGAVHDTPVGNEPRTAPPPREAEEVAVG
jgi:hypothetical protein